jgi:flagellum-specific peptidoglycan hydrolase FlgJ
MTPQLTSFLKTISQACLAWEATVDLPYKRIISIITVAQAALETGWGKSSLCAVNNFGGVQHHIPQWPGISKLSREVIQGQNKIMNDCFQCYPTLADYIADHASVLLRWQCVRDSLGVGLAAALEALGPWTQADHVALGERQPPQHSNYSTDPTYPAVLTKIVQDCGMTDPAAIDRYASS